MFPSDSSGQQNKIIRKIFFKFKLKEKSDGLNIELSSSEVDIIQRDGRVAIKLSTDFIFIL